LGRFARALRGLGAVFVLAAAACASQRGAAAPPPAPAPTPAPSAAAPPPAPPPTPTPAPRGFSSLAEAQPALVSAEDRRAFDAPTLDGAARSSDAAVRARAALALGRIGDARAAEPLRRLLGDASPAVRRQAAFASGILGEAELTAALIPLLDDSDATVAAEAGWSLGMLGTTEGRDALVARVRGASAPERRASALRGLWRFADAEAIAAATPYARDADAGVRTAALYVLARKPKEASLASLTAALADPDPQTAALCARALGILGKPESIAPLAESVMTGSTPLRINALIALEAIFEKNAAAPPLLADAAARVRALSGDSNPNVAVAALPLLRWQVEDREAFRRLWTLATSGKERRQQVALQALMAGLGVKSLDLVDGAIASPDPFLRGAAAEALSFLPAADAAPRRQRLSEDPAIVVRLKVLEGLKTRDEAVANRAIVDRLLADPDAGVRAAAVDALAQTEDPALLPRLKEIVLASYPDRAPDVPLSALSAAQAHAEGAGAADARAVAEAAYGHPSTLVSRMARRALVRTFHADPAQFPWREYDTGKTLADYAAVLAESGKAWVLTVETARGGFALRLDGKTAPLTVANLLALAGKGYFDGAPIHRIVPNFVVQDGDPTGTGNGGPGYEIRDEVSALPYTTGTVGMALAGPDTGGSQWFVTQAPEPHLDGGYTVFGSIATGMDVVLRLEQGDRIVRVSAKEGS